MKLFITLSSLILLPFLLMAGNPVRRVTDKSQIPPGAIFMGNLACDCSITQDGLTYSINALMGTESAVDFYDYGIPLGTSANTGLELEDALILFLYEEIATGIISLFLIADIPNDDDGGSLQFEFNCAPDESYISVQDDGGEFFGSPPLFTGNWNWGTCCTDGGVIENIGCNSTLNLDLLVSSGIDSIVWITGDIDNPTHILMSMTGEAITIDCGNSVCCPVGLDTEVIIVDATCEDSNNGSIDLHPQDGLPAYTFDWSNGEDNSQISDLSPGIYSVTVTDAQGCSEEIDVTVTVAPGAPPAQEASMEICSATPMGEFDLTTLEPTINLGTSFNVLWFQNPDLTGPILSPSAYGTVSTTVYAVVDNGSCLSEPVPVVLTVNLIPVANEASIELCEEFNGNAVFDLTVADPTISPGGDEVLWYLSSNLTGPINDPTSFNSPSQTVYAVIDDGQCVSEPVPVELIVNPKPEGNSTDANMCSDGLDQAIFDLLALEPFVSGGSGSIEWYLEIDLIDLITNPEFFQTTTTTVYAVLSDGTCFSDPIPVDLIVDLTPAGNPITIEGCDDGSDQAVFILTDYDFQVSGGSGGVDWWEDINLIDPVVNPDFYETSTTIVYATVDNGICISEPVAINLNVIQSPVGIPASIETCADLSGQGTFNLTALDAVVSGGVGTVLWYEDILAFDLILQPGMYMSFGTVVYAQINYGGCLSQPVPVDLIIINSVSATADTLEACDDGSGIAVFDLTSIDNVVSGGSGTVSWFLDINALMPISLPAMFSSGDSTVYARVTAGTCISDIVPIELLVLPAPNSTGTAVSLCGDANGNTTFNLTTLNNTISGGSGIVAWFNDIPMTMPIINTSSFFTGDTTVYASVSIGTCTSPPAPVQIAVSNALTVSPVTMEFCIPSGDTMDIDLTQFDAMISGGGTTVQWFIDATGLDTIKNPNAFAASTSQTLYVNTTDGHCFSAIIPVTLSIAASPESTPFAINRCGDPNGQITIDLTSFDQGVSNGTGNVTWYGEPTLTTLVTNPQNFLTSDTSLFATVTNSFCVSPVVEITVSIVDSLIAYPVEIQLCVVDNDIPLVNLTLYDFDVSGGSGAVSWFANSDGTNGIINTTTYGTDGSAVFASVSADGCVSGIIEIPVEMTISNLPIPSCDFTSIDSIGISWTGIADDFELTYTINAQAPVGPVFTTNNTFSIGGLGQGDNVMLTITALYDSICGPLTNTIACITDACPPVTINFPGLASTYCRDTTFILLAATPVGGTFSGKGVVGDTLFPGSVLGNSTDIVYTWSDPVTGCVYDELFHIDISNPWFDFTLRCGDATFESIEFVWDDVAFEYYYTYSIDGGASTPPVLTTSSSFLVNGLQEGTTVAFTVWSVGIPPCSDSAPLIVWCTTKSCPFAEILIVDPGRFCADGDPVLLEAEYTELPEPPIVTWSGNGIIDPLTGLFDPGLYTGDKITVTLESAGCIYKDSTNILVIDNPIAAFTISGPACADSILLFEFTGLTYFSFTEWHYNFDGAVATQLNIEQDHELIWDQPGDYIVSLQIDRAGCLSNNFELPITIYPSPEQIVINCKEEDYYSISVEWEPVNGATSYIGSSSIGTGKISGTTYTINNLPDNTTVDITIEAVGAPGCGESIATIECTTLDYIPPQTYIPDIFSPNDDGVNDVFFIQTNSIITEISVLRIFDRWGELLFEQLGSLPNDPALGWDGEFHGKPLNPGVYLYWAEVKTTDHKTILLTGDVTLIR